MSWESRIMCGRGPDLQPRVLEVDSNGYLAGIGFIVDNMSSLSGASWNVDINADPGGDGTAEKPFQTIGEALSVASAGDSIAINAGTYTETGLDVSLDALELRFELGVVIDPASGTALTVSGDFCKLIGEHEITPATGETGLLVTGDECVISSSKVVGGAIGVQVTGTGVILSDCAAGYQTSIAYDLQGHQGRLYRCKTVGSSTTIGYKINGGADTGVLESCTSAGHQTSGFYIGAGSQDWTLLNCSSGSGDGRWVDVDDASVWSNFSFDDEAVHLTTFDGSGPGTDNLFKVSGCVEIQYILGGVHTALSADVDNIYLDLWDGTNSEEITDNGSGGVDTDSADAGSVFVKTEKATSVLTLLKSNQCRVEENTNFNRPRIPFILNQKKDTDTYIRLVYSGVATSGAIHWHCKWFPLTEDGFLEEV